MTLNLKLQSNTLKNQAKNIELELQNLKARQANELLGIIQPYLPQIYIESDGDSTNTYLFFKRMASKADLLNSGLAERYSLPDSLNGEVNEALIGICEVSSKAFQGVIGANAMTDERSHCAPLGPLQEVLEHVTTM
jgi:dynactin 1